MITGSPQGNRNEVAKSGLPELLFTTFQGCVSFESGHPGFTMQSQGVAHYWCCYLFPHPTRDFRNYPGAHRHPLYNLAWVKQKLVYFFR